VCVASSSSFSNNGGVPPPNPTVCCRRFLFGAVDDSGSSELVDQCLFMDLELLDLRGLGWDDVRENAGDTASSIPLVCTTMPRRRFGRSLGRPAVAHTTHLQNSSFPLYSDSTEYVSICMGLLSM
jgi:hypothetical protein